METLYMPWYALPNASPCHPTSQTPPAFSPCWQLFPVTPSITICRASQWHLHLMNKRTLCQYKDGLFRYGIFIIKIRRLWDHLIFIMGIPILARQYLYTERGPEHYMWFALKIYCLQLHLNPCHTKFLLWSKRYIFYQFSTLWGHQ